MDLQLVQDPFFLLETRKLIFVDGDALAGQLPEGEAGDEDRLGFLEVLGGLDQERFGRIGS